jgi:lipoyl(octanoyl) transferase
MASPILGSVSTRRFVVREIGLTEYGAALEIQRSLRQERIAGTLPDTLILTEHSPVITLGKNHPAPDLRAPLEQVVAQGIPIVQTERGGDITYHGPGQLVVYGIIDLRAWDIGVVDYVTGLEEAAIRALAVSGIVAGRKAGARGCWVGGRKIASVGVHVSRGVTMHGIAINVGVNLQPFDLMNPCGMADVEMTSMEQLGVVAPDLEDFGEQFVVAFREAFHATSWQI